MLRDFNPLTLGYFLYMKRDYGINIGTKKIVIFSMDNRDFLFRDAEFFVYFFYSCLNTNVVVHCA